jgi:CheY-like chemotaxis protein
MKDSMPQSQDQSVGAESRPDAPKQTEKMRLMGEMASGIVHDFNNLLGAIVGRVQLAQGKNDLADIKKQLDQIEKIVLQGGDMVKRLQVFTRFDGRVDFHPVELEQVIDDALEVTRHRWETQSQHDGITYVISKDLDFCGCSIIGLHSELVDVITNLIFNALDAMPDGGQLRISSNCEGGQCVLVIADDGAGMSSEQAEQVFDPFFTTKGTHGTGLGLAVVHGIVIRHQGEIRVESELGKGSRFVISLPMTTAPVEAVATPIEEVPSDGFEVLLVDDDLAILDIIGEALREVGHTVTSFDNGAEAIVAMKENNFDIVITDLGMPGITGWEVARQAAGLSPRLPVIVISGWGGHLNDQQVSECNIDTVLAKPFHLNQLRLAITEVTAKQHSATQST